MTAALYFVAGDLADPAILSQVLQGDCPTRPHSLAGWALLAQSDGPSAVLSPDPAAMTLGLLLELPPEMAARLGFFTKTRRLQSAQIQAADGAQIRLVQIGKGDRPFLAGDWTPRWQAIGLALAQDIMAQFGQTEASQLAARQGPMLVRAAGRARAEASSPVTRRHAARPGDVQIAGQKTPYAGFFAIEEYQVAWRQFDGAMGPAAERAVFLSGDAVTVLPYDPRRDRVLLIDQFRAGPFARGDRQPWLLEAIAGRIDPGETPEEAARREAVEEAGLDLQALIPVAGYYPTPGANSEFLYSFVALTDLPDGMTGVFGLETEAEDIRTHLLPFAELMQMVASGEASNAPLILTALWLERERARIRAGNP